MNISIISTRVAAIVGTLVLAFSVAFVASAEVSILSATLNGETILTVEPGEPVTVDLTVAREGSEAGNDWEATSYQIGDGDVVCLDIPNPDAWQGSANSNGSFDITAPAVDGTYEVEIGIYRDDINSEGAVDNNTCPEALRDTVTLTLNVVTPVDPSFEVLSISPLKAERLVGESVEYTAVIEIKGNPIPAVVQCVVFDIFTGDGWQTVDVNLNTVGTHEVSLNYLLDVNENDVPYTVGDYDVVVVALGNACDDLPDGFDTADYRANGNTAADAETVLHIVERSVEPELHCVSGTIWNDTNEDGELSEGEEFVIDWEVEITNGETTESTTTDGEGGYSFCVPAGTWTITQVSPEGWTYSFPNDGEWVVTLPIEEEEEVSFVDQIINFFIPTAYAAVANSSTGLNFGVFQQPTDDDDDDDDDRRSNSSSGTRVDRDRDSDDDDNDDDTPTPQVLGEATTAMPLGAPATGAGGTAPVSVQLPSLVAILSTVRGSVKAR